MENREYTYTVIKGVDRDYFEVGFHSYEWKEWFDVMMVADESAAKRAVAFMQELWDAGVLL